MSSMVYYNQFTTFISALKTLPHKSTKPITGVFSNLEAINNHLNLNIKKSLIFLNTGKIPNIGNGYKISDRDERARIENAVCEKRIHTKDKKLECDA